MSPYALNNIVIKKPIKEGGTLITDGDFNVMLFTENEATARLRKFKKNIERSFVNGFKFKSATLIEREEYFAFSLS